MGFLTKLVTNSSSSSRGRSVSALLCLIAFCLLCGSLPGHWALSTGQHNAESSVRETGTLGGGFLAKVRRLLQIIPGARIVGGDSALVGRYPYMLSLRRSDSSHVCGAVLIHKEFALTAAHCVQPGFPNSVNLNGLLAIGAYERGDDYTIRGVELVKIREVFIHPNFISDAFYKGYDIALLQLRTPTGYAPIPLPARQYIPKAGDPVLSLGWGTSSINLQQVNLKVNLTADCINAWEGHLGSSPETSNRYLCAWNSTADTCGGDSGGPLIVAHSLRRVSSSGSPDLDTLVGITSFGDPDCHRFMLPAVYTSVAPFVDWIEETIRSRANSQALSSQGFEASYTPLSPQQSAPSPAVARSADLGCTDDESCATANRQLTVAIKDKDLTRVEGLLEIGTPPQMESVRDEIPLHVAAGKNYLAIAKALIESGADVDFQDSEGFTALMRASVLGHIDMMRLLISSGANLEITDYGAGYTALMAAAAVGAEEPSRLLIDKGADLKTDNGHSVLHIAASANAGGVISLLLDSGADINHQDQDGNTALHVASYFGAENALQVLLSKGADTSVKDKNGFNAEDLVCGCRLVADDPQAGCEADKCSSDGDKEDLVQLLKNFSR